MNDAHEPARLTRRTAVAAIGGGAAALLLETRRGLAVPASPASDRPERSFQSGSPHLGMSREEWVAALGPGEQVEVRIGDDMYAYAVQIGMVYVTFREFSDGAFASYIEFQFDGDGLTYDRVEQVIRPMMPEDARATDAYVAPAPPSGPTAIATWRYESELLGSIHPGIPGEFLSMRMQQRGADDAWIVSSAHLMAGEIMQ